VSKVLWRRQWDACPPDWWIFPTLRCHNRCSYCAAAFRHRPDVVVDEDRSIPPDQWIAICHKLTTPQIAITGGDPFLYPGLLHVIESIPHHLMLFANLDHVTENDIARLTKRGDISVICSYHHKQPGAQKFQDFAAKAAALHDGGLELAARIIWDNDEYRPIIRAARTVLEKKYGVFCWIEPARPHVGTDFRGCRQGELGPQVLCQTQCFRLAGPDGYRYPCQSKMFRNVGRMENLVTEEPGSEAYDTVCDEYGLCMLGDYVARRVIEAAQPVVGQPNTP